MSDFSRRAAVKLLGGTAIASIFATAFASRAQAASHTVRITNFAFQPTNLTISAGDTVTFVNDDGAPHTATSDAGAFDTGRLNTGQSASLRFSGAGTHNYICTIRPRMKGRIVVQ